MRASPQIAISVVVEGPVDEAIIRRLIQDAGGVPRAVYGRNGKEALRKLISGYNRAAHFAPWVVLVDLDRDADCAPPFCAAWLPRAAPLMCFRCAVRAAESWLLGDAKALAQFMRVSPTSIPHDPEVLPDPKRFLVDLACRSRRPAIREDMVPPPKGGRAVGPAYTARLIEFVEHHWRPEEAARHVDSLDRCRRRLAELVARAEDL